MSKISILTFPCVILFTLIIFSCDKNKGIEDIDPLLPSDTILLEDLSNCDPDHNGQFTFEYQDSIYQFTNPSVVAYVDTIPGSAYFLPDSISFYKKTITIKVPLSKQEEFILEIVEVEDPFSDCLPLNKYFEVKFQNYENGIIYCIIPNPDNLEMTIPLCSGSSAQLKTIYENGSGLQGSNGMFEVTSCEN